MDKGNETILKLKIPKLKEGQEIDIPKPKILLKKTKVNTEIDSSRLYFTETVTLIFRRLTAEYNSPDLELMPNELFSLCINHEYLTKSCTIGKILSTPTYYVRICKVMNKYFIKNDNGYSLPKLLDNGGKIASIRKMPRIP